jgi:hypothetical protein
MRLNEITAFTGECDLPKNGYKNADFNAIIDTVQDEVLRDLLGQRVYTSFMADVDAGLGTPTKSKHLVLLNGGAYDTDEENADTGNLVQAYCPGVKRMLRLFTFARIVAGLTDNHQSSGSYEPSGENSSTLTRQQRNVSARIAYNTAIALRDEVVKFLQTNYGQYDDAVSVINVAGTYTITFAVAPTFLYVGDVMTGNYGGQFTVTVIAGAVVTATATAGQDDTTFTWYPFGDVVTVPMYLKNVV